VLDPVRSPAPVAGTPDAALSAKVAAQTNGERLQSTLFFDALRRLVPPAR
jgi:hypothetical protein